MILVDAARQVFAKKGYDDVTMLDIAKAADKVRRTVYLYFNDKREVYEAVIDAELELISASYLAVVHSPLSPEDKLVEMFFEHLNVVKTAVKRNGNLRAEFFRDIWKVEHVRKRYDMTERELITNVLIDGKKRGVFDIVNVPMMTDVIQATMRGLEVPYIFGRLGENMTREECKAFVSDLIHRSLCTRKKRNENKQKSI